MVERLFPGVEGDCGADTALISLRSAILSVEWEHSPAGPIVDWPSEIRSTVRTALRAASPMAVLIGKDGIVVCNNEAREIFGDAFDEVQGKSILDVLPIARDFYRAAIDESFRGYSARYRDQPIKLCRSGLSQTCWFNLGLSPIVDDRGCTSGTLLVASETTEHVRTRKSLNVAHERMEIALDAGGIVGTWDFDISTRKVAIDGVLAQQYGVQDADAVNGVPIETLLVNVYSDDRARVLASIEGAAASGDTLRSKFRAVSKDAAVHWYIAFGRPVRDDQARITSLAGILIDVTTEAEAVAALEHSNLRFDTLVEAIPQIVWSTDAEGNHDYFNNRWVEFTGIPREDIAPDIWTRLVHPEDWRRVEQKWHDCRRTGETYDIDYRFRQHDGSYRWLRVIALPMRDARGAILRWYGTSTDIDDAKQLEAQKELVTRELDHRIRNLFALVNGLVGLSAREEPQMQPLTQQLRARLASLHKAHDLILRRADMVGCSLKELLMELLAPYLPRDGDVLSIRGNDVLIRPEATTSFALIFHELATNAAKYGALKSEDGRLEIALDRGASWLDVVWSEKFSSAGNVSVATGGFGSRLLESVVEKQLRGKLTRNRSETGIVITLQLPLSLLGGTS
jgi:PAS domain S-box-containing protein